MSFQFLFHLIFFLLPVVASIEEKLANYHLTLKAEMFIVKALEKILSDREIKRSYNSSIKKCCEQTLGEIQNESK